jgi:hypothetical protein
MPYTVAENFKKCFEFFKNKKCFVVQ